MSRLLLSATIVLLRASHALGQRATPTINPLNEFIGVAGSLVSVANSAVARETAAAAAASASAASASAAAAAATSAPAPKPNNGRRNMIIAVVCAVVGVLLLLAIVLGICCFLKRHGRRRRNKKDGAIDDEKIIDHSHSIPPTNPGRTYVPVAPNRGVPGASPQPRIPMVAAAGSLGLNYDAAPPSPNPFVPVPPSPRKPAYSNSPVIDTTPRHSFHNSYAAAPHDSYAAAPHDSYTTAQPYITETSPLAAKAPRSRSNSRPRSGAGLSGVAPAERPSTPFGLSIGHPHDETHLQVLQAERPSSELWQSIHHPDPVPRHHTPPHVPSRSPHRRLATVTDTSYQSSSTGSSATNSGSGDDWRPSPVVGGNGWSPSTTRYSNGHSGAVLPAPPVPWDHSHARRPSGDRPRNSPTGNGGAAPWIAGHNRQGSGTSINGQPRRQRFSDLQAEAGGNSRGNNPYESRDDQQYPRVVGQAL